MQMRFNRNIFTFVVAFATFAGYASAQNLDPVVEVNRAYEGKLMEVHKPVLDMAVPDSIMRFDLDFDYSVFESPYKGSYEFNPYLLSMKPGRTVDGSRRFFLRAGAGYQLHPQLDLIWSPETGNRFKVDVYAQHRSFVGNYWNLKPQISPDGAYVIDRPSKVSAENAVWKGYDLMTKAGFDAKYDWKKGAFSFGADYFGLAQKDKEWSRSYNALDAYLGLSNKGEWAQSFLYDFRVDYRYGAENTDMDKSGKLVEHIFDLKGSLGPVFRVNHKVLFDFGLDVASSISDAAMVSFVPHYVYEKGPFMLDMGVRIAALMHVTDTENYQAKGQLFYPDIRFHIALIPDAMRMYLNAGGGTKLNTYSSLIEDNHHIIYDRRMSKVPLLDYSVERISLVGGFEGRISSRFSYNLRGGYVNYASGILDAVSIYATSAGKSWVEYVPYQKWFAGLDWCLDVESFRFDGSVVYTNAWGDAFEHQPVVRPAALTGNIAGEYNWKRRIFVGADCEFMTARQSKPLQYIAGAGVPYTNDVMTIPGYADLGVYAEYVTSRGLSFWMRGGNLLNMTIQRNPLYAEKGPYFTVGICLNL